LLFVLFLKGGLYSVPLELKEHLRPG